MICILDCDSLYWIPLPWRWVGGGDSQKTEFIYPGWKEENEKEGVKKEKEGQKGLKMEGGKNGIQHKRQERKDRANELQVNKHTGRRTKEEEKNKK
jgi:hypothetical protein